MPEITGKRRVSRGAIIAVAVMAAFSLACVFGPRLVLPRIARSRMERAAEEIWDGSLTVETVELGYFGPLRLRGVRLSDRQGRLWLRVREAKVHVSNRFGDAKVHGLELEGLEIFAHFTEGRCSPPVKPVTDDFHLLLREVRDLSAPGVRVFGAEREGPQRLLAKIDIHVEPDGDARGVRVAASEAGVVGPVELTFSAWPGDMRRWDLTDGEVSVGGQPLIRRAASAIGVLPTGLTFEGIRADVHGGLLTGSIATGFGGDEGAAYHGDLKLRRVPLAGLGGSMGWGDVSGTVEAEASFAGAVGELGTLRGTGTAAFADVQLNRIQWFRTLRRQLGLLGIADIYDVKVDFDLDAGRVVVRRGVVDGATMSARIEPGGTADLITGEVDMYMVAAALRDSPALQGVPLVSRLAELGGELSRQRVSGFWNRPDAIRMTPAPLEGRTVDQMLRLLGSPVGRQAGEGVGTWLRNSIAPNPKGAGERQNESQQ